MDTLAVQATDVAGNVATMTGLGPQLPLYVFGGVILFAVATAMFVVVTTRRRTEKRTANLLGQLDEITDKLNEAEKIGKFGSFTWNFQHPSMSFWSDEMFALSGLGKRKVTPTISAMIEAIYEPDRLKAGQAWSDAQKKPGPFSFVYRAKSPTGGIGYVRIDGITTLSIDKTPYSIRGVAHDVTKEMEVDKAKTEFVSLASHQLKTPLTAVRWHCEGLLAGTAGALSPEQTKSVKTIQEANMRMIGLVNDLLNISRIELNTFSLKPEDIDVRLLVESVVAEQMPVALGKQLNFKLVCPELPHIFADKTMARMIFQNLLSNAIKYTPNGGSVTCTLDTGGAKKEGIFLTVTDTGIGIPKAEQSRVFEKLHRASNAEQLVQDGTGLGLYVIKMILEHAGGGITFESVEEKGTTFYATIPLKWKNTDEDRKLQSA